MKVHMIKVTLCFGYKNCFQVYNVCLYSKSISNCLRINVRNAVITFLDNKFAQKLSNTVNVDMVLCIEITSKKFNLFCKCQLVLRLKLF